MMTEGCMSQAESKELVASILDDRLRPFLPLIYVAWSDDELSPDEFAGLCRVVAGHSGIDIDCQVALQHWLDQMIRHHRSNWRSSGFASLTGLKRWTYPQTHR